MAQAKKTRGRPEVGRLVGTRWPDADLAKIDAYAQEKGLSRAEAIRELVRWGLIKADDDT